MSVHAALAGRPAPPKPARRSVVPGVIALLAGPALLLLSCGWGSNGGTAALAGPGLAAEPRMQLALPSPQQSRDACPASRCIANPKIQTVTGLPVGTSAPNTVITEHAMRRLGLATVTAGWLFQTELPPTAAQLNTARQLAVGLIRSETASAGRPPAAIARQPLE